MDHIDDLPPSGVAKYDAVFLVVDQLTKMAHFVLCHVTDSAATLAHLLLREVICPHGPLVPIISD